MIEIIVWSESVGYQWAYLENGNVMDEFGNRPDLEGPDNDKLIEMQLREKYD